MTKTELDATTAPADVVRQPAELTEAELNSVSGGGLPPIRGPQLPPEKNPWG